MLIVFGGLPGTGKTTLATALARRLGAIWLRIDTIEAAIARSGTRTPLIDEAGYLAGSAIAEDNLRLGRTVIADSVNPVDATREAWRDVARRAGVEVLEVEIVCSDAALHRHRVETRPADIPGHRLPSWFDVLSREYHPWQTEHAVIDTATKSAGDCVEELAALVASHRSKSGR